MGGGTVTKLFYLLHSYTGNVERGLYCNRLICHPDKQSNSTEKNRHQINSLSFDRHEEETAVATFARGLKIAGEQYLENPTGAPLIPNWNRITSAIPDFLDMLHEAVEQDSAIATYAGGTTQ